MLTLPGATTYFEDGQGKNGFDYLLAKQFAESLGVKLVVQPKFTLPSLLRSIDRPSGDFAAANLVITEKRKESFLFSNPYHHVIQQVIYKAGDQRPRSLEELTEQLVVISDSSHSEQLVTLSEDRPNLSWIEDWVNVFDASWSRHVRFFFLFLKPKTEPC